MIKTNSMKFVRLGFLLSLSTVLTSCQTWEALKESAPVKLFDDAGSSLVKMWGENNLPTDGKPASMQERARQIESRGSYAGKPTVEGSPVEKVAVR